MVVTSLDCHPEIGNNAILAQKLGLLPNGSFLPFEGTDIGLLADSSLKRTELRNQLQDLFPKGMTAMEFGSESPHKIALLTGSGQSAVDKILGAGTDTLITGELKQHHFNMAQELKLNSMPADIMRPKPLGWMHLLRKLQKVRSSLRIYFHRMYTLTQSLRPTRKFVIFVL